MENKKFDMSPLNPQEIQCAKKLIERSQKVAEQFAVLMTACNLYNKGFDLTISVNPQNELFTLDVALKRWDDNADEFNGKIERYHDGKQWHTLRATASGEFINLFDAEEDGSGTEAGDPAEENVPSDGRCADFNYHSDSVDGGDAVNNG